MPEPGLQRRAIREIGLEGGLGADRLGIAARIDTPVILAAGAPLVMLAGR